MTSANRRRILVVHLDSIFPKVMASQDTVFKMVCRLAVDHDVDIATTVRDQTELDESRQRFAGVCRAFHPIVPVNPATSQIRRKLRRLQFHVYNRLFGYPHHYFYAGRPSVMRQLAALVAEQRYDVVQAEYWYMGQLFDRIDRSIFKTIDTHDVLSDKLRQEAHQAYGDLLPHSVVRALETYRRLEADCLRKADLVVAVSEPDQRAFRTLALRRDPMLVTVGQDLEYFKPQPTVQQEKAVLFYGSMGGEQNIHAFFRFWKGIFPAIKAAVPGVRLYIVGANPPEQIRRLADGERVVVTGFVDDVRPYIARCAVCVIPLDVAAGFRSRTVEVMGMGVPVIGTHMALDSVGLAHGSQGFIADDDAGMAEHAVHLLLDAELNCAIGREGRRFVEQRYSIEATIGRLSRFYQQL